MQATRTLLVALAAAVAAGCSRTSNPLASSDTGRSFEIVQTTNSTDSVSTELRGVHTLGSGN